MTRRFWKRVFLLFLLLIAVGVFKIGVLVAFHLWPRAIEPPLWDEADLVIDEKGGENGWDLIRRGRVGIPDREKTAEFLQYYEEVLKASQFIDNDPLSISERRGDVILLLDLHRNAWGRLSQLSEEGKGSEAYTLWLKIFRQDHSWMESARSLLSHMVALQSLVGDMNALKAVTLHPLTPPDSSWSEIRKEIELLDPSKISLKRALIYEYLQSLNSLEMVEAEDMKRLSRLFYNRELTKRDLNRYFRRYAELLDDPKAIPEDIDEVIAKDFPAMVRGPFWWLVNPVGRLLERIILPFHLGEQIKEFYEDREQLLHQIDNLRQIEL